MKTDKEIDTEIKGIDLIASVIRMNKNYELGGSQDMKISKNANKIPAYGDEPRDENGYGQEAVNALTFVSPLAYKFIIHMHDQRVTGDMIQNLDQNLRVTKGLYMIKYLPTMDKRRKKGRPWIIGQDLIRMSINLAGWRHWNFLCDRIPELDWLRRNSTLTQGLFDIAAKQPGMSVWFTIDWCGYAAKLAALPEPVFVQKGGTGPFAAYKCSGEEYRKHYKDKCATLRVLGDVLREVQEVEELSTVQKEMLDNAGETGITREQYIKGRGGVHQPKDPVTGRFLKKNKMEE